MTHKRPLSRSWLAVTLMLYLGLSIASMSLIMDELLHTRLTFWRTEALVMVLWLLVCLGLLWFARTWRRVAP